MTQFSSGSRGVIRTIGSTGGTSSVATNVATSASANTKGTVVELVAATEFDADWALIALTNVDGGTTVAYAVDILIGAATEQIIIPDLVCYGRGNSFGPYLFPIFIPKGSRISARSQSSLGVSVNVYVAITLISGNPLNGGRSPSWVSGYGTLSSSLPTNIDPGGSANTDSAWTQLTASTDRDHHWLGIGVRFGDGALTAATSWRLSIGIGAATEAVLIPDLHVATDTTADLAQMAFCLPCFIPRGSRLTAKVRSSVSTDGDRDIWIRIYGAG